MKNLAIIGGGSWGTALSIILAPRFEAVRLWAREPDLVDRMLVARENDVYLPGFSLPLNVIPTDDLGTRSRAPGSCSGSCRRITRAVFTNACFRTWTGRFVFVSATKGLENGTLLRMTQVVEQVIGRRFEPRVAALSGPTFAREVARGEPAALVISSHDAEFAAEVQAAFAGPTFRLYTSRDPVGVELGAALKNVIAIAAGICHGLKLGSNTMAALITRGLAEISRLAMAVGGEQRTLAGLAGLGDLVLTCTGELSRNRSVGIELAKGRKAAEIAASMRMVAEGIQTTRAAIDLARREGVEMPITEQMHAIIDSGKPPRETIRELMERSLKPE